VSEEKKKEPEKCGSCRWYNRTQRVLPENTCVCVEGKHFMEKREWFNRCKKYRRKKQKEGM